MNTVLKSTIGLGAAAALALPTALVLTPAAHADIDKFGTCGAGVYEFSVDREDNGSYDVSVDLDRVAPGTRWRVQMSHNGKGFVDRVVRADREGDVEVERNRPNSAGTDVFRFKATRVGSKASCSDKISV